MVSDKFTNRRWQIERGFQWESVAFNKSADGGWHTFADRTSNAFTDATFDTFTDGTSDTFTD